MKENEDWEKFHPYGILRPYKQKSGSEVYGCNAIIIFF